MRHKTLASMLEIRGTASPDRLAYAYLGETRGPKTLTYGQLRSDAHAIAARLKEGGKRGERVLLLYPPGLELIQAFFGCVSAGAIAVPAPPPNPLKPRRSLERLVSIVDSAWPAWALTTQSVLDALRPSLADVPAFEGIRWVATDNLAPMPPEHASLDPVDLGQIALIQYTSGSTSDPKGAALTHGNLAHNIEYFEEGWHHDQDSISVNWLPAFHDLGLIYGILTPLWRGFVGLQMSPIDVIQRPYAWLNAMSAMRATHSAGPNFIYELCARKVTDEEKKALDLSRWKVALTAAEPVRAETMTRFLARFGDVGFRRSTFSPGYGLSEGTCKVVAVPAEEEPTVLTLRADRLEKNEVELAPSGPGTRSVVGCGRPGQQVGVEIVDPATRRRVGPRRVGEVWVSGPSVASSYWNQPAETEAQLRATIDGAPDGTTYLRTGDLGFVHGGQLFITGRIKDVIIVRGNNHYPQDIEGTVQEAHPSIRAGCVAAFPIEEDGEEKLCVVAEIERRHVDTWAPSPDRRVEPAMPSLPPAPNAFLPEEVVASITRAVAESHGLRVHRVELIRAGTIPKTTSGKIQRRATRAAMLAGKLERVATGASEPPGARARSSVRDDVRAKVVQIVSQCGSVPREKLVPSESLHRFGIDSLAGVNIAYEIGLLVGRDVPPGLVAEQDTVEKLVDYVLASGAAR